MIGEIAALGVAPLWAISSILLKSQTDKIDALQINALRGVFASVFVVALVPITGRIDQLSGLSFSGIIYLLLAVLIGMVLGDTIYIVGMKIVGVSKALPMSIIYPILVLPFSIVVVGERLSFPIISGIFIAVIGLLLLTAPSDGLGLSSNHPAAGSARKQYWWGIFLILAASLCWAGGTIAINFAMIDLDPILAGAIRMPFMTLILFMMVYLRKGSIKIWSHGIRSLTALGLAGILGIGVGGLLFMVAIKQTGPTKTAILSSTAPLFGAPLSVLILHEKITLKIVLGTILCVAGTCLIV